MVYALSASLLVEARPVHGPAPDMAAFVNPLLASAPGDVKKLRAMRDPPPRVYATGATSPRHASWWKRAVRDRLCCHARRVE